MLFMFFAILYISGFICAYFLFINEASAPSWKQWIFAIFWPLTLIGLAVAFIHDFLLDK